MNPRRLSNLRQIGVGIRGYIADHDGTLPGPLWPGQIPTLDPNRDGRLVRDLAVYLQIPKPAEPQVVDLFGPPAVRKAMPPEAIASSRTFVMNMFVQLPEGSLNPWGSLAGAGTPPLKVALVPPGAWAMSNADQQHPRVTGAPWQHGAPAKPVHGKERLALFFDGRVSAIAGNDLLLPTSP